MHEIAELASDIWLCHFFPRLNATLLWSVLNLSEAATYTVDVSKNPKILYVCNYMSNTPVIPAYYFNRHDNIF